jgi:hypothetical protein
LINRAGRLAFDQPRTPPGSCHLADPAITSVVPRAGPPEKTAGRPCRARGRIGEHPEGGRGVQAPSCPHHRPLGKVNRQPWRQEWSVHVMRLHYSQGVTMPTLLAQDHRMRARLARTLALKGPEQPSPGHAPGLGHPSQAVPGKGDTPSAVGPSLMAPFQGSFPRVPRSPGRCPGLVCRAPSGQVSGGVPRGVSKRK